MKQKRYVEMTRQEWRLATEGLNYELVGDHFTEGRRKPFWSAGRGSSNTIPLYIGANLYLWYRLAPFSLQGGMRYDLRLHQGEHQRTERGSPAIRYNNLRKLKRS